MSEAMQTALAASIQLHKIPKSSVDVYAMVLESGGSDLAALITAASVALANAGIELFDLVPACNVVSACKQQMHQSLIGTQSGRCLALSALPFISSHASCSQRRAKRAC